MTDSVASIASELRRVNDEVRSDKDAEFGTVSNDNVIVIASKETSSMRLDSIISAFTRAHPSRFFILKSDDSAPDISVNVSALCHSLGGAHKVCSEILSFEVPTSAVPKLSSIIRSHLLSGRLTELLIADDTAATKLYPAISSTCDIVYLDSSEMQRGIEAVKLIEENTSHIVDLSWIRLTPWREAVKAAFDKPQLSPYLENICEVSIRHHPVAAGAYCAKALLLAGWIITRLSADILSVNSNAINCRTHSHKPLVVTLDSAGTGKINTLQEVCFSFDGTDDITVRVVMGADGTLTTEATTASPIRFTRQIQELSEDALLTRHFLIGESTQKFNASLQCALLIYDRLVRRI